MCIQSDSRGILLGDLKIVNVVASTRIEGKIDVEVMTGLLSGVKYEPEIFSGLIYRKRNPKVTLVMFSNGKISSMGSKSEYMAKKAIITTIRELDDMDLIIGSTKMDEINIENVVGVGEVGYDVDLELIVYYLSNAIYEPEQFPSIIYRPYDSIVCLLFASGKVVLAGGKSEKQVIKAFHDIEKLIKNYLLKE